MVNLLWLTKKLVSINSVSGNELAIQKFIFNLLQQEGFKPRFQFVYKGRPNVVCTSGEGKQHLLLDCHVDTVPACAGWKANPLKVRVQGGRMIGLGAADQKAGVAIHLKQFIEGRFEGRTTLAAVCDEEIYSAGTHHFLSKSKNDFTAALFSEPSFSDRIRAINQVPGRFAFDISVIGKSAHGATGLGTNAIVEASRLIGQINGIKLGRHPLMGAGSINIGSIESGSKFLSVPEECTFRLDRCTVAGETMAKAKGEVLEAAKKAGLLAKPIIKPIKRPTPFIPAGMTSPSSPLGLAIKKAFRQNQTKLIYGKVDSTFDMGYAVDAGIPSFSIGPVGGNLHAAEEYVLISSIEKCYSIYLDILKNL